MVPRLLIGQVDAVDVRLALEDVKFEDQVGVWWDPVVEVAVFGCAAVCQV